jgi:hypothetical protein
LLLLLFENTRPCAHITLAWLKFPEEEEEEEEEEEDIYCSATLSRFPKLPFFVFFL